MLFSLLNDKTSGKRPSPKQSVKRLLPSCGHIRLIPVGICVRRRMRFHPFATPYFPAAIKIFMGVKNGLVITSHAIHTTEAGIQTKKLAKG